MPDLVMHYYFADRLLEQLEKDARKSIGDKDLYYFASAGPDPFFFTNIIALNKMLRWLK